MIRFCVEGKENCSILEALFDITTVINCYRSVTKKKAVRYFGKGKSRGWHGNKNVIIKL